jgi:hypothetical protein
MGPTAEAKDQGAKMVSVIASILGVENEKDLSEGDVEKLMRQIKDPWAPSTDSVCQWP